MEDALKAESSNTLLEFERQFLTEEINTIAGVDEAGRGPLAGPVYAAAVILNYSDLPQGVNDSKKLSPAKRHKLFDEIKEKSRAYSIASASTEEIEKLNILGATLLAMRRALEDLKIKPSLVLIDGNSSIKNFFLPQKTVIGGDRKAISIAAASILAKVSRDYFMEVLHLSYPEYNLKKHKGYGTKEHLEALKRNGPSPVHRKSFLKKFFLQQQVSNIAVKLNF